MILAAALGLAATAALAQAPVDAPTAPASAQAAAGGLTKGEAMQGFYLDVTRCLTSLEQGGGIAGLPPEAKADLRPALPRERFLYRDPKIKVWTTDRFGDDVLLAERTADRCEVVADQLPVEATFKLVLDRLRAADPSLKDYPVKPGYNPIVYQLERTADGFRYVVHLEGSEPGGLGHPGRMLAGHAFRFSLLTAFVVRQPESAKPLFR